MQDSPSSATPSFDEDFRLEIYPGVDGDWRWRMISVHNGKNLLNEGYRNKSHLVDLLRRAMPTATIHETPEDGPEAAAQPASRDASGATWSVAEFDPTDIAPEGDPELDCDGAPDAS